MAGTYTTVLGDAWDGIAFKLYGDEKYMKDLIEANWKYTDVLVFGSGVVLTVPEIDKSETEELPFWRVLDDDEDELEELYESEDEEGDEDEDDEESEDLTDEESEAPDDGDEDEDDEDEDEDEEE